jgi:prolyl-tRNA synthetase
MKVKKPKKKQIRKPESAVAVEVKVRRDGDRCSLCHHHKLSGNELEEVGKFFKFGGHFYHYFCILFR